MRKNENVSEVDVGIVGKSMNSGRKKIIRNKKELMAVKNSKFNIFMVKDLDSENIYFYDSEFKAFPGFISKNSFYKVLESERIDELIESMGLALDTYGSDPNAIRRVVCDDDTLENLEYDKAVEHLKVCFNYHKIDDSHVIIL